MAFRSQPTCKEAERQRDLSTELLLETVQATGCDVRIDGVEIAADWFDLVDGDIAVPLEIDKWGDQHNNLGCGNVWTGTLRDGTPHGEDACTGWMSLQDASRLTPR